AALTAQAVATARVLPLPKTGGAEFSGALARVGRDGSVPAGVRLDALATTTPAALSPVDSDLFDFLRAHLDAREPMLVRGAAANVLAKAPLTSQQQLSLAGAMKSVGALEAPKL